jgi:glycosyltransferase involved in cell wall biosynthesis
MMAVRQAGCSVASLDSVIRAEVAAIRASGLFLPEWYLTRHPEIAGGGDDGVPHFCKIGWQAGAEPNPYFNPAFYLANNPEVAASRMNPLLHYIARGDAEGLDPCPFFHVRWYRMTYGIPPAENCLRHFLARRFTGQVSPVPVFDAAWYLENNPDVAAEGADPFEHFLAFGPAEGRDPAPGFDMRFYLNRYGKVLGGQNPLLHFIANYATGGFHPARPAHEKLIPGAVRQASRPSPDFEEFRPVPPSAARKARLLAFYLPQFHPIPENDAWWGKGFTDWTNLGRAVPRYAGHLQPRVPRDLGFYTLDDPAVLRRQIDMAIGAGLSGFVFYYYWFNRHRLLEKPLAQFCNDPTLDFPFCVMWANENWTRRWDGLEREVLIAQEYRERDDAALVASFAELFADPRYIRLQGRPLLMIYRVTLIPDAARRIAVWRELFRGTHGEDPVIIMAQSLGDYDPAPYGLDGAIEFPPHKLGPLASRINQRLDLLDENFSATVYEYADIAKISLDLPPPDYPLIKTIVPGWDNEPRREGQGLVLHGASPRIYQAWLEKLIRYAQDSPFFGEPLIGVNAWNEWAEGAFLEPDLHFGAAFLNATGRALCAGTTGAAAGILFVGHDAHPHGAQLLLLHLATHLRRRFGMAVHVLLLGVGPLLGKYHQAASVSVAYDKAIIGDLLDKYHEAGIRYAIVNSAASSRVVPWLMARGIATTLLIHEMPNLLKEYNLEVQTRLGITSAANTVFSSEFVRQRISTAIGLDACNTTVLPQGNYQKVAYDPAARRSIRHQLGIADDAFVILGVGFADFRKGFDLFIQIARRIGDARTDTHFLWCGDITFVLATYLQPDMAALRATGKFHHVGFTESVAGYYSAADIYALTSREDPYPTTVLEALACGIPCVGFDDTGGIPDLLRSAEAGVVVPRGDTEAFAGALETLMNPETLSAGRPELQALAAQQFDFPRYAQALLRIAQPGLRSISVCVLNYNYAQYLDARLGSIFAQTYPVTEILFLDDASTDGSHARAAEIAQAAQRDVTFMVNPQNSGSVFAQWQRAAVAATGEYIWLVEADDLSDPQFLERLMAALETAESPLLGFTDSRAIDESGATTMRSYQSYYFASGVQELAASGIWPADTFARKFLAERNLILNVSAVLWRRTSLLAALERVGSSIRDWRLAGDWMLYLELLAGQSGNVAYLAEPLNTHRRHAASITAQLDAERHVAEIDKIHQMAAEKLQLDPSARARQATYLANIRDQFGLTRKPPRAPEKRRTGRAIVARRRKV